MTNNNTTGSRFLPLVFICSLFVVLGLTSCSGGGFSSSHKEGAKVETTRPPVVTFIAVIPPNTPTVQLDATSLSIAYNSSTDISWTSTNSSTCTSHGGGGTGTSGSFNTGPLTATTTYIVTCSGTRGSGSDSITITVAPSVITGFSDAGSGYVTVTSANNLINGSVITISGTTNYNGTYTVSNVTATSFTIPMASFPGNDATGSWQLAGGMISGCINQNENLGGTPDATQAITISIVPSRFRGAAPLSVFFDATGTTIIKGGTPPSPSPPIVDEKRPFHDLEYRWDFRDDTGAVWKAGSGWNATSQAGNNRNFATGPVAAHVFENPGTYLVKLNVTDGTNTVSNSCAQIVVQKPDDVFAGSNTVCISSNTVPVAGVGGCPADADVHQQANFATAINTYAYATTGNTTTGKRILFKRGDSFTSSAPAILNHTGPGIVGAYGPGNVAPIIRATTATTILGVSSQSTPTMSDWRVMDLEFDGASILETVALGTPGSFSKFLLLRMNMHNVNYGTVFNTATLDWHDSHDSPGHNVFDEVSVVDSIISPIAGVSPGWRIYGGSRRFVIMGNVLGDVTGTGAGSHVVRVTYAGKAVISNNTISKPGAIASDSQQCLKLHGGTWCDASSPEGVCLNPMSCGQGLDATYPTQCANLATTYTAASNTPPVDSLALTNGYTEQVIVSDNVLIGASVSGTPYMSQMGPQASSVDERVRDVIVERNLWQSGVATQAAMVIEGRDITVRNNLCNLSNGGSCVAVMKNGNYSGSPAPTPDNVKIFNNTMYSNSSASNAYTVRLYEGVTNIDMRNNLMYTPNISSPTVLAISSCGGGCTAFTNSDDSQAKNTSPHFVATPPVLITDWKLTQSAPVNYAIDSGTSVPVWSDFFRTLRPNGTIDIGATEYVP